MTRGQFFTPILALRIPNKSFPHSSRNLWSHIRASFKGCLNGLEQFRGGACFQQVCGRSLAHCLHREVRIFVHGQEDNLDCGYHSFQLSPSLQAVQSWHPDVDHSHIGFKGWRSIQQGEAIRHRSHHLIGRLQEGSESFEQERVVVSEYDPRMPHRVPLSRLPSKNPTEIERARPFLQASQVRTFLSYAWVRIPWRQPSGRHHRVFLVFCTAKTDSWQI